MTHLIDEEEMVFSMAHNDLQFDITCEMDFTLFALLDPSYDHPNRTGLTIDTMANFAWIAQQEEAGFLINYINSTLFELLANADNVFRVRPFFHHLERRSVRKLLMFTGDTGSELYRQCDCGSREWARLYTSNPLFKFIDGVVSRYRVCIMTSCALEDLDQYYLLRKWALSNYYNPWIVAEKRAGHPRFFESVESFIDGFEEACAISLKYH